MLLRITVEYSDGRKSGFTKDGDIRMSNQFFARFVRKLRERGLDPAMVTLESGDGAKRVWKKLSK